MGLFDRFQALGAAYDHLDATGSNPFHVTWDDVVSSTEVLAGGRKIVLVGANNYLGLTFDADCVAAGVAALRKNGTGTTGSRIANGTYHDHDALEREIAAAYGTDHAMVFTTGFQANLGVIATVAGADDALIIDSDSHASIYEACKLSPAKVIRFRHNDAHDLNTRLARLADQPGNRIVVSEGLFSMLGDEAPLKEIVEVKNRHGAFLILDEAHSLGVYGENGLGLAERDGLLRDVDIITGTFSKSMGAVGGYCVSSTPGFGVMRVTCRPYMFSASLPTSVIASVRAAFQAMLTRPSLRHDLWRNVQILRDGLEAAGFRLGPMASPIVAVHMSSRDEAVEMWRRLFEAGYYVNVACSPATPAGVNLLRCSVSAAHDPAQLRGLVEVLTGLAREMQGEGGSALTAAAAE